ncbi:MAG TPA: hypothetical protein VF646_14690 [Cytophagales bacterium]
MHELVNLAIQAQGGLERWRQFHAVSAHLDVGGVLWGLKRQAGVIEAVDVRVSLREQEVSHTPNPEWHTRYTPGRVAIQTAEGAVLEELPNPRASFGGHTLETPWSRLQLAYFAGYAMWNYFNTPFQFARPGFGVAEMEPWPENGETWRRLRVTWPGDIHTHSGEQVCYVDAAGLIRRLDYAVEISGNSPAAHYLYDYRDVDGIRLATRRVVYLLGEDNRPRLEGPVVVSIDLTNIQFESQPTP